MTELAVELKRIGHFVTVISTTPHYNILKEKVESQPMRKHWLGLLYSSEIEGIKVWHVKVPYKGRRVWLRVLDYLRFHVLSVFVAVLKVKRQDVVIATSPPLTMGIMSWLLAKIWSVPSVYKVAEIYPDVAIRQGIVKNKAFIWLLKKIERFIYRKNTVIIPIAEQFAKVVEKRGVLRSKLKTIPDFVDVDFYCPKERKNEFSIKYNLTDEFIVLYAGNIGIVQDWEIVLYAAECLKNYPIKFVIIGDGAKRGWLREQITKRSLTNILLLGYQLKEMMPLVNASCDVSIIPMNIAGSKDGVPSKIYSIMSCAKPPIALVDEDSEIRYIIGQSGCGKAVSIGDGEAFVNAILEAYNDRENLHIMGMKGREYVKNHYSKEAIVSKYDELIKELTKLKIAK